ncbi:TPA: winged helix-turn-helix transcriptional regulator [Bacillus cereus]
MKENQPTELGLKVFEEKWNPIIIYHLIHKGTKRYSELQKLIPAINKRMLTLRLKELKSGNIIARKVYGQVPPKVEYSITEYGYSLKPILVLMNQWGNEHINKEKMGFPHEDNPENVCSALTTINILAGKWKVTIINKLFYDKLRFYELQKLIPNINKRMLTIHLRDLEAEGIILRKVYQQVPPKVEYSITEYGETLKPILCMLNNWVEEYHKQKII